MILKKNDLVLLVLYLFLTVAMTGYVIKDKMDAKAGAVVIVSEGKEVKRLTWPAKDQSFEIKNDLGFITVKIENNKVSVTDADCHDQVCVRTRSIDQGGEMIVCLPHKIYVEIQKDESGSDVLDGFSQ